MPKNLTGIYLRVWPDPCKLQPLHGVVELLDLSTSSSIARPQLWVGWRCKISGVLLLISRFLYGYSNRASFYLYILKYFVFCFIILSQSHFLLDNILNNIVLLLNFILYLIFVRWILFWFKFYPIFSFYFILLFVFICFLFPLFKSHWRFEVSKILLYIPFPYKF